MRGIGGLGDAAFFIAICVFFPLGLLIWDISLLLKAVGFVWGLVTDLEVIVTLFVLGAFSFMLFGMGSWLQAATTGGGSFWKRWWLLILLAAAEGLARSYLGMSVSVLLALTMWIAFTVVGVRAILRQRQPASDG